MNFNCGDIVIKTTGGNKMTIASKVGPDMFKCLWFVENSLCEGVFHQKDLVTIPEWKRLLKTEEREDKINQLLG